MSALPSATIADGADRPTQPDSYTLQIRRCLDAHFYLARRNGLSLCDSAAYAVQNKNSDLTHVARNTHTRPSPDLMHPSNPTSSQTNSGHSRCTTSFATDHFHMHNSSSCCSSQLQTSQNAINGRNVDDLVGSSHQDCLRQQMKTLDDDEKLRVCRSQLMAPYMRAKLVKLESAVRSLYKSQYVRTDRQGSIVTQISHDDVYGHTLGCKNYARKCKLKANCCGMFVCCRLCHDEALGEDHEIDRFATESVLCTICLTEQPVSESCVKCHTTFADYFCSKCRFYENSPGKKVFHCHKCNICRVGEGLDIDTFHCERCECCIPMKFKDTHSCNERAVHADCPICTTDLFTSKDTVEYTRCGHTMHQACFDEYIKKNYQCPLCRKSLVCMDEHFSQIDQFMLQETLPPEFQRKRCQIICNDCERKSVTAFHFIYHKCEGPGGCNSYNTRVINTFDILEDSGDNCDEHDDDRPRNNFDDDSDIGSRLDRMENGNDMDITDDVYDSSDNSRPPAADSLNVFWELEDGSGTSEYGDDQLWDEEDFIDENTEMAISVILPSSKSRTPHLFATVGSRQ